MIKRCKDCPLQYECKICKKLFKNQSNCTKHAKEEILLESNSFIYILAALPLASCGFNANGDWKG